MNLENWIKKGQLKKINPEKQKIESEFKRSALFIKEAESDLAKRDFRNAGLHAIDSIYASANALVMNLGYEIFYGGYMMSECIVSLLEDFYVKKNKLDSATFNKLKNYLEDYRLKSYSTNEAGEDNLYTEENKTYVQGLVEFAKDLLDSVSVIEC